MSTDEVTFDAPVATPAKKPAKKPTKRAKPAKKKAARAKSAPKPQPQPKQPPAAKAAFPGLTRTACADGCNAKGCVISGGVYCAHPTKGGLQSADLSNPAALKRIQAAREQIAIKVDPDRFT